MGKDDEAEGVEIVYDDISVLNSLVAQAANDDGCDSDESDEEKKKPIPIYAQVKKKSLASNARDSETVVETPTNASATVKTATLMRSPPSEPAPSRTVAPAAPGLWKQT